MKQINIATVTRFKIKNLTPHPITILDNKNNILMVINKSDEVARVNYKTESAGELLVDDGKNVFNIPITKSRHGKVKELPEGIPEEEGSEGYLIVSEIVKAKFPKRKDLLTPNYCIRDQYGKVLGCRSLGI